MPGSTIVITAGGTNITDKVQFRSASFEGQIAAMPGTFNLDVIDVDQTLDFTTGDELTLDVDGQRLWGGYILNVNRAFAFPAVDTTTPAGVTRIWKLSGSDYNILFDKRVIHNPNNHYEAFPFFGLDLTMGQLLRTQLLDDYLDISGDGLTWTASTVENTFVPRFDADGNPDPDGTKDGTWPQQGSTWRVAMDDFSQFGCVYYINPAKEIHFHEADTIAASWGFSDNPNNLPLPNAAARYGMREFEETDDGSGMVNDAFVWGGSEWAANPSKVKFKRSQNVTSINTHNRWQYAETRFGDLKSQGSVTARANVIVSGTTTGAVVGDTSRGLSVLQHQIRCAWFSHDVPTLNGDPVHLRPSQVVPFTMYVMSEDGVNPLTFNLPLRTVRISFPNLDADGNAYVRFDGFFGVQYSDPWWLWTYLRDVARAKTLYATGTTSNTDTAALYGSQGSFEPSPETDGSTTTFSIPFSYIGTTLRVFRNGALVSESAYTKNPEAGTFTFGSAPAAGTDLWVLCTVAGGIE